MIGAEGPAVERCSRACCTREASSAVHWRNPRIHGEERVKTWLACEAHTEYLRDYLATRGFPVIVTPVGTTVVRVG
ncbi:hypothetical protein BH09ACT5_BH09ACT5_08190 [soil metagenome]